MSDLNVGTVYEIRNMFIVDFGGHKTPEREFLKLIGYSSKGFPVFQDGDKYQEIGDGGYTQIHPLKETPKEPS